MSKGTTAAMVAGGVLIIVGVILTLALIRDVWQLVKGVIGPLLLLSGGLIVAIAYSEYQAAKEMERLTAQAQVSASSSSSTQPTEPPAPPPPSSTP